MSFPLASTTLLLRNFAGKTATEEETALFPPLAGHLRKSERFAILPVQLDTQGAELTATKIVRLSQAGPTNYSTAG